MVLRSIVPDMQQFQFVQAGEDTILFLQFNYRFAKLRKAAEVDRWALGVNTEVSKVLKRVESVDVFQIDIPEPHCFNPWHLGQEVEIRTSEPEGWRAEHPCNTVVSDPRNTLI